MTEPPVPGSADTATARWEVALRAWAIPEQILAAAPASPWGLSPKVLRQRTRENVARDTPSRARALDALPPGGVVLDVGVGAGAAGLPLAPPAGRIIGVDESVEMLYAFSESASDKNVAHEEVHGRWPDIAGSVPQADVVVCHHVFYNVPDLALFARRLTSHARRRVVVEITETHPMSPLNDLWLKFHDLRRPTRPTAADAVAVLREVGVEPEVELWVRPSSPRFETRAELITFVRRRLCLNADSDALVDALLEEKPDITPRGVATIWWDGQA